MCKATDFSAVSKPIELRMRVKGNGLITYVTDPQSDEESTEMVTNLKVTPAPLPVGEDVWFLMNHDFAMEGGHSDEFYCEPPVAKSVERVSQTTTPIDDSEWMAMNEDFAQESSIEVIEVDEPEQVQAVTQVEAAEEGDYGLWWEAPAPIHEDVYVRMHQDFAVEGGQFEEDSCPKKAKSVERVGQATTPMDDNEWMAMNEDFARESHIEVEEPEPMQAQAQVEAAEEGDYGVWWE